MSAYKRAQQLHKRRAEDPFYEGDILDLVDFCVNSDKDERIFCLSSTCPDMLDNEATNQQVKGDNYNESDHQLYDYHYTGPLFGLKSHKGFIYMPQAISPSIQRDLAYQALSSYCEHPHATNLDSHQENFNNDNDNHKRISQPTWKDWQKYHECIITRMENNNKCEQETAKIKNRRKHDNNINNQQKSLFEKLSWSTLGYLYDWTERKYKEECQSPMPNELQVLGQIFAKQYKTISHHDSREQTSSNSIFMGDGIHNDKNCFNTSAAIVNYYTIKSMMGGHRDDLEFDFTKPVISISIGLPAIFLLGGSTKDEEPVVPILVRPGDVMLLGGECRLCYHGMARVIPPEVKLPSVGKTICNKYVIQDYQIAHWRPILRSDIAIITPSEHVDAVNHYLSTHRININLRQVLPSHMDKVPR